MKKLFTLFALAAVCLTTGCSNNDNDDNTYEIKLEKDNVTLSRGEASLVFFSGGSGDYSATIDNPEIGDVGVQWTNLGEAVLIKGKKEGEAKITVIDKKGNTAQCTVTVKFSEVRLPSQNIHIKMLNTAHRRPVYGGSGQFTVTVGDPEIADASFDEAEYELVVSAKQVGETTITITDDNNGKSAECSLTVTREGQKIVKVAYAIDAEKKDDIEAKLKISPYPIGSKFIFEGTQWTILSSAGTEIISGKYATEDIAQVPPIYQSVLLLENKQILSSAKIKIDLEDNGKFIYDAFAVKGSATRLVVQDFHFRYYEDLTEYYQEKYPDAGVKGVARVYVCEGSQIIAE